jgi:hypothetical protein
MKKKILFFPFVFIASILLFCSLNCLSFVAENSIYGSSEDAGIASYWLDAETSSVHKMVTVNEKTTVVSIIRYNNGNRTEVMDLIKSEIVDGKVNWSYYVPSTGYTVEMKAVSSNENEIAVSWNNKNEREEADSGDEILVRCKEDGTELSPHNRNMPDD